MAPRNKAEDKLPVKSAPNETADTILNYLRKQNRPYSASDVSANLHNKVTKATAVKMLKDLHERNEVEGRVAGKQIVYHAIQNPEDSYSAEQLSALDTTIDDLRTSTVSLQATIKTLRNTLSSLNSTLTTSDLISSVPVLEVKKQGMVARLSNLKAGIAKETTKEERDKVREEWKEERDKVREEWKRYNTIARTRAKISKDMWRLIEDLIPEQEQRCEIRESLGLDDW